MSSYQIAVTREFTFEAAHVLPWHPGKCAGVHGHSYRVEVRVVGELDENGIVVDFDELLSLLQPAVINPLDHTLLNDTLPNPTAELLAMHVMAEAERAGVLLAEVRVRETADSAAIVTRA